jgi:hypothetical protein
MSTRGVSPALIKNQLTGDKSYSSGAERLLAMVEKWEKAKEDYDLFYHVEDELFELVKSWVVTLSNSDLLAPQYHYSDPNLEMSVKFTGPEAIQTEREKLENIKLMLDLKLIDQVEAVAKFHEISIDQASERVKLNQELPEPNDV